MKIAELFESASEGKFQKATRLLKFSLRNFENNLGVDLHSNKFDYYYTKFPFIIYVGKRGQYKVGDKVVFVNGEKPNLSAFTKSKHDNDALEISHVCSSVEEVIKVADKVASGRDLRIIVDEAIVKNSTPAPAKEVKQIENPEDGYFTLGYWGNAYKAGHKEYFWSGAFSERKDALAWGNMKMEKGQPSEFKDWVGGKVTVIKGVDAFVKAANAAGFNPNVKDLDLR
jgi:hypothetical protein